MPYGSSLLQTSSKTGKKFLSFAGLDVKPKKNIENIE
jgi:hypothetical protein